MLRRLVALFPALALAALTGMAAPAHADVIVVGYQESSIRLYAEDGTELPPIVPPFGFNGVVGPAGITYGPDGLLYVSNQTSVFFTGMDDSIVKVDPATGDITPFIDLASGYVPAGLRFGPDGNLYVSHNGGQFAGQGTGSVDVFDGSSGAFLRTLVSHLTQPTGLWFDNHGNLYVSNFGEASIVKVHHKNQRATTLVPAGTGGLAGPTGLQIGPDGNLYVVDLLLGAVRVFDPRSGGSLGDFIPAGGHLDNEFPSDLLFDDRGNLLVADLGSNFMQPVGNVKLFDATGGYVRDFATGIFGATQLLRTPN
jgi:DNA-binding beta-propeller fold protein YncE